MHIHIQAAAFAAALSLLVAAAPAGAAQPERQVFEYAYEFTDTGTCGFPIAGEFEFRNVVIDSSVATGTGTTELHQSNVGTLTANGVSLRVSDHYTIFVTVVNGVPVSAKHVGVLDDVVAPDGRHVYFRTGQAVYDVVLDPDTGYYVDGGLVTRHGLRANFDTAAFCAAFS